ncbi:MAG: Ras GTPase activating protein ira2 [Piccolia ochrophora]|nr:MAG: Ras GTPase activating protein ira2 [Piccolia ochrophora]
MGDGQLVNGLVERLTSKLPHRTGVDLDDLRSDTLAALTRETLIEVSKSAIPLVFDVLIPLLHDLTEPASSRSSQHTRGSQVFLLELLADCCRAHWDKVRHEASERRQTGGEDDTTIADLGPNPARRAGGKESPTEQRRDDGNVPEGEGATHGETHTTPGPHDVVPPSLRDSQAARLLDLLTQILSPIPEKYQLPASSLLEIGLAAGASVLRRTADGDVRAHESLRIFMDIEHAAFEVIEYLSATNWSLMFNFLQNKLRNLRAPSGVSASNTTKAGGKDTDVASATGIRVMSHLWINGRKLSLVIQELCGCFLNLSKSAQHAIAVLLPETIARWLHHNPHEFVAMHMSEKRLDGVADVLFDMANSMNEDGQRKGFLWPLLTSLLLLLPEVFWVAGNMKDARNGSVAKRATFLESLRKNLNSQRSSNTAVYCLTGLCRVAHYLPTNNESALLSYALDVQNELREKIFEQWSTSKEISPDVSLTVAAFVSLSSLNLESTLDRVVPRCFALDAPLELQIAALRSCTIIAAQPDAAAFAPLFASVARYIRIVLQNCRSPSPAFEDLSTRRSLSADGSCDVPAPSELLSYVFEFLVARPETLVEAAPLDSTASIELFNQGLEALVACLVEDDEQAQFLATNIPQNLVTRIAAPWTSLCAQADSRDFLLRFWRSTSTALSVLSNKLLLPGLSQATVKLLVEFIRGYLRARLSMLDVQKVSFVSVGLCNLAYSCVGGKQSSKVSLDLGVDMPERSNASADLEVAFLVLLCSSELDICAAATSALALSCEESALTETMTDLAHSSLTLMRNYEPYRELSSQNFRITGLVAFQKRFRKLLSMMTIPTGGVLSAWEVIFFRWIEISSHMLAKQNGPQTDTDEKAFTEWRNYSGFLASVGGCCVADGPQAARMEDSMLAGLRWIDRVSPEGDGQSLLERFIAHCLDLLFCANVRVREATKEVLGSELSFSLLPNLLRSLETQLILAFEAPANATVVDLQLVILEQAASLLRTTVERLDDSHEAAFSADFGSLSLDIARSLDSLKAESATLRAKIKIGQLCEVVTSKRGTMKLGHGIRVRNQVLAILFGWMAQPAPLPGNKLVSTAGIRVDELVRQQRDLDRACLRAIVNLTHRLPLQPSEGQIDPESSESRAQLFQEYFRRLLAVLESDSIRPGVQADAPYTSARREDISDICELSISALSNLLSANIDVGLKDSLEMGYHESPEVRTAFLRVLCNILSQGTEFERLSESAISAKHDVLLELIVNDLNLTVAICDACPIGEIDELTLALLTIFEARGMGFQLLKALIEHEVAHTDIETELLRRNCVATKLLSAFARWKGFDYLRSTLGQVLERLIQKSDELDLELDPTRTTSHEELQHHATELRSVTQILIDDICSSGDKVPPTFRRICHTIATAVTPRFPEAKFTAVGAFIFLRFFCPAIVAPDSEGLVTSVPTKEMRRGLLLIAKIVQNLANNVLFGAKEPYMYSLNDFLTQNIYRVTTFLRQISNPCDELEEKEGTESYDFASCTSLHKFLFDHWDMVRQRALVQERRSWKGNSLMAEPDFATLPKTTSIDKLGALIPSLGPPNVDISWNRPQISANTPPAYFKFQEFMLRAARRNTETGVLSRAVYDGGHTKDDMPVICIILRSVEQEGADQDSLVYSFLKIASRMWHRPFCALIDATCYAGLNDPQDELIQRLDSLSPSEMSRNFSRLYIYNMNSAYRKALRHVLRFTAKHGNNVFHPGNIEYHLIGSLQELQTHFQLNSLQLPKDTVSVVTDSRVVFQPVVRLSKTKGKVEVVVKVGTQYVQVTTTRKQDIIPGFRLSATVNDIFRITEVDETKPSGRTEDTGAFGLRTDNSRIVMYFTSPRKSDILQSIRLSKSKHVKEVRPTKSFERLMKPEDVPGSLLNISLMNLASSDRALRLASYNLLCGLSKAFHFAVDRQFVGAHDLNVPANSVALVTGVSEKLAKTEGQLTADFLSEFFLVWDKLPLAERPLNVLYMAPWLANLRDHIVWQDSDGERGREKVASIVRKLVEIVLQDSAFGACFQENVWPVIAQDEVLVEVALEEMIKMALEYGPDTEQVDTLGTIAASIGTATIRGKIIARLRKTLNRSSLRPTRALADNVIWNELCVLLRMCLVTSFDSRAQSQLFLPELFHIITMVAHSGSHATSRLVHTLLINTVHTMCVSFPLPDMNLAKLKAILATLSEPKVELLFNVYRSHLRQGSILDKETTPDTAAFASLESMTALLLEVINFGAPSTALANVWRSRWMSLVASTSFQSNPAIQPRAFAVMGGLARGNVDDDLLYQVLVSLRTGIHRFTRDDDSELLVSIVSTLTKMMTNVSAASRYVLQLFWLAICLVRVAPPAVFECVALFLEAVLQLVATSGSLNGGKMASVLLQGRVPVEEATVGIDELYGIYFTPDTFHFASAACLVKGLTEPTTQVAALRVLSSFLEIASASAPENRRFPRDMEVLPYLGLVASRASSVDESREILWLTGITPQIGLTSPADVFAMVELDKIEEKDLLLNVALSIADFRSCEDFVQQRTLTFLVRIASQRPGVLLQLRGPVIALLDDVLRSCQTPLTLRTAHVCMRALATESRFSETAGTTPDLHSVFQEAGLSGLWKVSSFKTIREQQKHCGALIDKLIELIII